MTTGVNTGKVTGRRDLEFRSFDDVRTDLDRLQKAHDAGSLRTLGNWSAGQVFDHLAAPIEMSIDGFPFKAPLPIRTIGPLFKKRILGGRGFPGGIKLSGDAAKALIPADSVTFDQGMTRLRQAIGRVMNGERMTRRSPIFGRMSEDEWKALQLKHCALHLSFLLPS